MLLSRIYIAIMYIRISNLASIYYITILLGYKIEEQVAKEKVY